MDMSPPLTFDDDDFDPLEPMDLVEIVPAWRRRPDEIARIGETERFVLLDRSTSKVVGFHIEAFLARTLAELPVLSAALDQAALRRITRDEVAMIKRRLGVRPKVNIGEALAEADAGAGWIESIAV